jgi:carbamoyltransferase
MIFVAFYLGRHDSNVCAYVGGRVRYAKSERMTGIKHHRAGLDFVERVCAEWGIHEVDAVAFSDGQRNGLGSCAPGQLFARSKPVLPAFGDVPTWCVDHHYAHVLSGWPVQPSAETAVGVAIDGNGDNGNSQAVIRAPGSKNPQLVFSTGNRSFGMLFEKIGMLMRLTGNLEDLVGKVMGAQAYGNVDHAWLRSIDFDAIADSSIYDLIRCVPWRGAVPEAEPEIVVDAIARRWTPRAGNVFFSFDNPSFRDWLATLHHGVAEYVLHFFQRHCRPDDAVLYAGGCAQNVVCNELLAQHFPLLSIAPHSYDGGLSLGCLELLRIQHDVPPFSTVGFPYWQNDPVEAEPSQQTIERVADLLAAGKIVAWHQGQGELGPRALGHRSILMDPRIADAKDIINTRIKMRESWRPYAPSVLESRAPDWFEMSGSSRYMLRAMNVRPERRASIPAIVHEDGTARVQTVPDGPGAPADPFLALLRAFEARTGVPVLLNTSLNEGGSPIFSVAAQSERFYQAVALDALCVGDRLLVKSA